MPLPCRLGPDQHRDGPIALELHLCALAGSARARLDIGGKPDPSDATQPSCVLEALVERIPSGNLHGAPHMALELTGVVDAPGRGLVRHRLRLDEVERAD